MSQRSLCLGLLVVVLSASVAAADPPPSTLHQRSTALSVPRGIRAVVVDVDAGNVSVGAGSAKGTADEHWNLQEPRVTTSTKDGTLRVVARCGEDGVQLPGGGYVGTVGFCRVDVALSVPAGVSVDVTGDAVSVSGTRGATRVRATGRVTLTHLGPGALDAASGAGSVSLRASTPSRTTLRASGTVTTSDVQTRALSLVSDAGSASVGNVRATDLRVDASNAIALANLTASEVTATSQAGSVQITDVVARGALALQASNEIRVTGSRAARLAVTSDAGSIAISATRLVESLVASASNELTLDGVQVARARLTSSAGSLQVRRSPLLDLDAEASNTVTVDLPNTPRRVRLVSDAGALTLDVPRSSYAVSAVSDAGRVALHGIVIDERAPRVLDLHASGDVTVN